MTLDSNHPWSPSRDQGSGGSQGAADSLHAQLNLAQAPAATFTQKAGAGRGRYLKPSKATHGGPLGCVPAALQLDSGAGGAAGACGTLMQAAGGAGAVGAGGPATQAAAEAGAGVRESGAMTAQAAAGGGPSAAAGGELAQVELLSVRAELAAAKDRAAKLEQVRDVSTM